MAELFGKSLRVNQGLGDEKVSCLAAALPFCPNITLIDIRGNRLTEVSVNPILLAISNYMKCAVLNISDNRLDDTSIQLLKDNLAQFDPKIAEVEVIHGPNRAGDIPHSLASIEKAKSKLGYNPKYSIAQGIKEAVSWYWEHLK
jgi:nucleoside-diphosphate-sugar epimerase